MTEPAGLKTIGKSCRPGFLLEPLGWVQDRLIKAIEDEPNLIDLVFGLDQPRMHLVALALAHMTGDVTSDVAAILLEGSRKPILNLSVGHCPVGIGRALRRLPPKVLSSELYRNLVNLLDDPVTGKFLHHTGSITDLIITGLHNLPPALRRPPIMAMFDRVDGMISFADGLRFLASRTGLPFDVVANQIGALDQTDQVAAAIRQLVDTLPLPDILPPVEIGGFRRLDAIAEIRQVAKDWENCLADYLFNVNEGTSAIYLSDQLRLFVFYVATAGWAGFWFRPKVREMLPSILTSSPKFTTPLPMPASHHTR